MKIQKSTILSLIPIDVKTMVTFLTEILSNSDKPNNIQHLRQEFKHHVNK